MNRKLVVVPIHRLGLFMQNTRVNRKLFMQRYRKLVVVPIHRLGLFMQRYQSEPKVGSCYNT